MATTKPRITITLNDTSYAVLKAISECSGQPMSTFVTEMLDSARPTLERMAATFLTGSGTAPSLAQSGPEASAVVADRYRTAARYQVTRVLRSSGSI